MASVVLLEPVPATTGMRPATRSTTVLMTSSCSLCDKVGHSPVVPTGTMKSIPPVICESTKFCNPSISSSLAFTPLKGVTMAVPVPRTLEAMAGLEASVAVVDEYAKVDCDGSVDLMVDHLFVF